MKKLLCLFERNSYTSLQQQIFDFSETDDPIVLFKFNEKLLFL